MSVIIHVKEPLAIGQPAIFESKSHSTDYLVVFEDDGETGYFYGCDLLRQGNSIVDAMHIYNVSSVIDKHIPSEIKLGWSEDGLKAMVMINQYVHAVFDFSVKRGYCRSNFPEPTHEWSESHPDHLWDYDCLDLFR